jgi:hypothetical protein
MFPPPHMTHVSSSSYDTCILLLSAPGPHPRGEGQRQTEARQKSKRGGGGGERRCAWKLSELCFVLKYSMCNRCERGVSLSVPPPIHSPHTPPLQKKIHNTYPQGRVTHTQKKIHNTFPLGREGLRRQLVQLDSLVCMIHTQTVTAHLCSLHIAEEALGSLKVSGLLCVCVCVCVCVFKSVCAWKVFWVRASFGLVLSSL